MNVPEQMLIYSPEARQRRSQNVPIEERTTQKGEKTSRRIESPIVSHSRWSLVTEAIIFALLLVSLFLVGPVGCERRRQQETVVVARQNVTSSLNQTANQVKPAILEANCSFGGRISRMFALLGPRRSNPPTMSAASVSAEASGPSATIHLFDPSSAQATNRRRHQQLLGSEAHKGPPIYRSAPKQILEVRQEPTTKVKAKKSMGAEFSRKKKKKKKKATESRIHLSSSGGFGDLNSAAAGGLRHKRHKKRKKHAYPAYYTYFGKYHEHRSVPAKGAWEFGYKRGNSKHTIEREEHGHKSHFKTEVKWTDKKGKGHHVFNYNHGDHNKEAKKKHHGAPHE